MDAVLNHVPRKVTDEMNSRLDADYTAEEVKKALFQMFPQSPRVRTDSQLTFINGIGIFVETMSHG